MSDASSGTPDSDAPAGDAPAPPLFLVKGDASAGEVAALTVVLQALAAAATPVDTPAHRSEWAAHHRRVRPAYPAGPGGWRSSGMPR